MSATQQAPRTALIIEDLPETQHWLEQVLQDAFAGINTQVAASVQQAQQLLNTPACDLALVDLHLPDGRGTDLIPQLRQRWPNCTCVVSTIYSDDQHLFPALRTGAQGYLLKDQPREQLVARLQGIMAGEPPLSPVIARRLLQTFTPNNQEEPDSLTPRERETLTLIAKGFRLPEVSTHLGVTRNTAASYVKSVYRKLEISSRAEAALAAARMGLVNNKL